MAWQPSAMDPVKYLYHRQVRATCCNPLFECEKRRTCEYSSSIAQNCTSVYKVRFWYREIPNWQIDVQRSGRTSLSDEVATKMIERCTRYITGCNALTVFGGSFRNMPTMLRNSLTRLLQTMKSGATISSMKRNKDLHTTNKFTHTHSVRKVMQEVF